MMPTLVDSNVLIDIVEDDPTWRDWSQSQLENALTRGGLVINQIIYSEVSASFRTRDGLDNYLAGAFFDREDVPWQAAFEAGVAHLAYRRGGGARQRTLPDFVIGAHALVHDHQLLTRDARRYRAYFPDLDIIEPETHP